jgi:hypothetical protein
LISKAKLLGVALTVAVHAGATSIVIFYEPPFVYFGADSQISVTDGSEARNGCKIHTTRDFVWASSGLLYETAGPFDIRKIATESFTDGTPSLKAVRLFQDSVTREYLSLGNRNDDKTPLDASTDIFVAGRQGSVLRTSRISVAVGKSDQPKDQRLDCPSPACPKLAVFELGLHDAVDAILDKRHAIWKELGIPEAIRYLIARQETATPRFVSGPIAIMQLGPRGVCRACSTAGR